MRGGKRKGAGAPQGNTNARKHGRYTAAANRRRQVNRLILKCIELLAQALITQRAISPPPSELELNGALYKLVPDLRADIAAALRRLGFLTKE